MTPQCQMRSKQLTVCSVTQALRPITMQCIAEANSTDATISELREAISTNWPNKYKSNVFYSMRNELSISNDGKTTLFNARIIWPKCLQQEALIQAHKGHLGATKMKQVLRSLFFGFGMGRDIDYFVRQCDACLRFSKCNKPHL